MGKLSSSKSKLNTHRTSLEELLGGGKFADAALWRNKRLSGLLVSGVTLIWLLFEVAEYNLLSLLAHLAISAMIIVFVWCNGAALMGREVPEIPGEVLSKETVKDLTVALFSKLSRFFSLLYSIARGDDLKMFLLTIASLWMISVLGSCCSALNLLYLGFLSVFTLPFLYDKYEDEIDHLINQGGSDLGKLYRRIDSELFSRIPRGPGAPSKENKRK